MRNSYNENGIEVLILQGIIEAFASGILIYDCIANLMVPHAASESFAGNTWLFKIGVFSAMWVGAAITALIGYWA